MSCEPVLMQIPVQSGQLITEGVNKAPEANVRLTFEYGRCRLALDMLCKPKEGCKRPMSWRVGERRNRAPSAELLTTSTSRH